MAMGRGLEWLERCGQWGGAWSDWRGVGNGEGRAWSDWRGVGNGEGPGVAGEVWAMGRGME